MVSSGGDGTSPGETGREGTVSCAAAHTGRPHTLSWASEILRIVPPGQGGGDAGSPTPGDGVGASGTEEGRWGPGQEVPTRPGNLGHSGGCCCRCLPGLVTWGSSGRTRAKQEACLRPHCWGPAAAVRPLGCFP